MTTCASPDDVIVVDGAVYFTADSGTGRNLHDANPADPAVLAGCDYRTGPIPIAANGAFLSFAARNADGKYALLAMLQEWSRASSP